MLEKQIASPLTPLSGRRTNKVASANTSAITAHADILTKREHERTRMFTFRLYLRLVPNHQTYIHTARQSDILRHPFHQISTHHYIPAITSEMNFTDQPSIKHLTTDAVANELDNVIIPEKVQQMIKTFNVSKVLNIYEC